MNYSSNQKDARIDFKKQMLFDPFAKHFNTKVADIEVKNIITDKIVGIKSIELADYIDFTDENLELPLEPLNNFRDSLDSSKSTELLQGGISLLMSLKSRIDKNDLEVIKLYGIDLTAKTPKHGLKKQNTMYKS